MYSPSFSRPSNSNSHQLLLDEPLSKQTAECIFLWAANSHSIPPLNTTVSHGLSVNRLRVTVESQGFPGVLHTVGTQKMLVMCQVGIVSFPGAAG